MSTRPSDITVGIWLYSGSACRNSRRRYPICGGIPLSGCRPGRHYQDARSADISDALEIPYGGLLEHGAAVCIRLLCPAPSILASWFSAASFSVLFSNHLDE